MFRCSRSCPPLCWEWAATPFQIDPQGHPPRRRPAQAVQGLQLAKGAPLSESDRSGKPCFQRSAQRPHARLAARIVHRPQLRHVTTELIAYRQGFTPPSLSRSPPALEVHRPHLIGLLSSTPAAQPPSFQRPLLATRRGWVKPTCSRTR